MTQNRQRRAKDLPPEDIVNLFVAAERETERRGTYWLTQCPVHDDHRPSLKVDAGDKVPTVVTCYAGCDSSDIWHWIEEEFTGGNHPEPDFAPTVTKRRSTPGSLSLRDYAAYLNVDAEFLETMGVEERDRGIAFRFSDRTVKLRVVDKDGNRSFRWDGGKAHQFPLFPVPEASLPKTIYLCEGESDGLVARYMGLESFALTSGSSAAPEHLTVVHFEALATRGVTTVVLIPDCDPQGEKCMERLAISAHEAGLDTRWVKLDQDAEPTDPFDPSPAGAKDLHGWYLARDGQTVPDILKELQKCNKRYEPPARSDTYQEYQHRNDEPPRWIIPELVAVGDVVGIVAPPKSMKTYFMLHLVYCLASKEPLFEQGRYTPVEPVRCMIVEEEGNANLFSQRLHRVGKHYGDQWTIEPRIQFKTGFTLEDDATVEQLIWELNFFNIQVLVLDPWQRMTGERDESSSSETQVLWNRVWDIQSAVPDLTIFIVHHARKDAEMNQNMVRGSSRFMGEIDTVILLRKKDKDIVGMVMEGRDHEGTEAGEEKLLRVYWEQDYNEVFRLDGNEFTETVSITMRQQTSADKTRDAILDYLKQRPEGTASYAEIEKELDLSHDTCYRHMKRLLEVDEVVKLKQENPSDPVRWQAQ